MKHIDLTGKVFGKLTVIKRTSPPLHVKNQVKIKLEEDKKSFEQFFERIKQ